MSQTRSHRPPAPGPLFRHWPLERSVAFLNHGSFGACPRPVLAEQARWRARLERQPVRFLARELESLLDEARADLGAFLGADPDDLAFVPNATHAIGAVLRSLRFRPGDELLIDDHAYNAAANMLRFAAERDRARLIVAEVPFPCPSPASAVEPILARITPRTRLALVSHVTSPTALVFPIERLARALSARGVELLVDGAHAPGMVPLDLAALEAAGVTYYAGNGHKWLCGPKGSGFLWVRRDRQPSIRPLAISHGASTTRRDRSRFRLEFDWTGTADPSAYLALPAALRFMGALMPGGWPELMATNRSLALEGRDLILERIGGPPPAPDAMIGAMAAIPLPAPHSELPAAGAVSPLDDDPLQALLRERWRIEVPVITWPQPWRSAPGPAGRLVRISAPPYASSAQFDYLGGALAELLRA